MNIVCPSCVGHPALSGCSWTPVNPGTGSPGTHHHVLPVCQSHCNPLVIRQFPESCWEIYRFLAAFSSTAYLHVNTPFAHNTNAEKWFRVHIHTHTLPLFVHFLYLFLCNSKVIVTDIQKLNDLIQMDLETELASLFPLCAFFSS